MSFFDFHLRLTLFNSSHIVTERLFNLSSPYLLRFVTCLSVGISPGIYLSIFYNFPVVAICICMTFSPVTYIYILLVASSVRFLHCDSSAGTPSYMSGRDVKDQVWLGSPEF